jgi:hypothetical protein
MSMTYGLGGYDPNLPHNNVVEQVVDNGDGTGTHTDYTTDPPTVTQLTGLPIPDPEPPLLADIAAALPVATLEEANDLLAQLINALGGN